MSILNESEMKSIATNDARGEGKKGEGTWWAEERDSEKTGVRPYKRDPDDMSHFPVTHLYMCPLAVACVPSPPSPVPSPNRLHRQQ